MSTRSKWSIAVSTAITLMCDDIRNTSYRVTVASPYRSFVYRVIMVAIKKATTMNFSNDFHFEGAFIQEYDSCPGMGFPGFSGARCACCALAAFLSALCSSGSSIPNFRQAPLISSAFKTGTGLPIAISVGKCSHKDNVDGEIFIFASGCRVTAFALLERRPN